MSTTNATSGLWLATALACSTPLAAQNSAYGLLGIGFPSAPFGVVARSMGGGISATDPQSFLNPGALGFVKALSVAGASMQEYRRFSIGGASATGLTETRFPYAGASAPVGPHMAYALGFNQYAERTYDVVTSDTVMLRGAPVGVAHHTGSAGGIIEVRGALAWSKSPKLSVGMAAHMIAGSAKVTTQSEFSDPTYRSFSDIADASFSGFGVSAGVVASPSTAVRLGGSLRVDGRLDRKVGNQDLGQIDLPVTLAGGAEFRPSPLLRVAGTGIWRSWSSAAADVSSVGTHAFNTFDLGVGVEMGGARGGPALPLRLGARYATLPFSPSTDQPTELDLSLGTGIQLSHGRAQFDFSGERVMRDGAGAAERAWQLTVGFHVRP